MCVLNASCRWVTEQLLPLIPRSQDEYAPGQGSARLWDSTGARLQRIALGGVPDPLGPGEGW